MDSFMKDYSDIFTLISLHITIPDIISIQETCTKLYSAVDTIVSRNGFWEFRTRFLTGIYWSGEVNWRELCLTYENLDPEYADSGDKPWVQLYVHCLFIDIPDILSFIILSDDESIIPDEFDVVTEAIQDNLYYSIPILLSHPKLKTSNCDRYMELLADHKNFPALDVLITRFGMMDSGGNKLMYPIFYFMLSDDVYNFSRCLDNPEKYVGDIDIIELYDEAWAENSTKVKKFMLTHPATCEIVKESDVYKRYVIGGEVYHFYDNNRHNIVTDSDSD